MRSIKSEGKEVLDPSGRTQNLSYGWLGKWFSKPNAIHADANQNDTHEDFKDRDAHNI